MAEKIIMYSTDWCPDCRRSKRFLDEHGIDYEYVNIENAPEAEQIVRRLNNGNRSVPTIVFPDGSILVEPSNAQLAEKLGTKMTVT
ncbi:MAG: mycoredoxin [Chloroflexota bacterium]